MTAAVAMTTVPELSYDARLDPSRPDPWGRPWTITFGFGKPAQGTYTTVGFAPDVVAAGHPEQVLEEVVRQVAVALYGQAWADKYRPEQYVEAVDRWGLRHREHVVVTAIRVWS